MLDNSILAFSAASFKRCSAIGSFLKSIFSSALNSSANQLMIFSSTSSPPKWVSPSVANTSKTPSPNSRIETSCVPPPKSNTTIFLSSFALSNPYASAAAVGSFIILLTFNPAISPASLVACLCASLKYAGTVTTASETSCPK